MAGRRIPVAVLGATGLVGQRFVALLDGHPWFEAAELGASPRSVGRTYADAVPWRLGTPLPRAAAGQVLRPCDPSEIGSPLVLSALDASAAGEIETAFAAAGRLVVTNARNHRMDDDVPLLVPEINADHRALLAGRRGGIVANPNCTTVGLVLALAPLHRRFGVLAVSVVSMQALSGAGLPGPAALEALGNVLPHIPGEEEKVALEPAKILGRLEGRRVIPAEFPVSAACHRVPVRDGHLLALSVRLDGDPEPGAVEEALATFRGAPEARGLPSTPDAPIELRRSPERPQPVLDRAAGAGMSVVAGPAARCPVLGVKFRVLVHNTLRGAAGAALLNAELLRATGHLGDDR